MHLAKDKYGIDIPDFATTQHQPIQITLNNLDDDIKDSLSSQSHLYNKVLSNSTINKPIKQLPKIEEAA